MLQPAKRTVFSAELSATRKRFALLVRMKWGILRGVTVKRQTNKNNNLETIAGPLAQRDYMPYFNYVDNNYHESYS